MFHLCRVCLATEETFKFESIFDNNGKGAKEIFLLSGLRMMHLMKERDNVLICPECSIKLDEAIQLRNLCLESSKYFEQETIVNTNQPRIIKQIAHSTIICDEKHVNDHLEQHEEEETFEVEEVSENPEIINIKSENINDEEYEEVYEYIEEAEMEEVGEDLIKYEVGESNYLNLEVLDEYCEDSEKEEENNVEDPTNCNFCASIFNTREDLDNHIKSDHLKVGTSNPHKRKINLFDNIDHQCKFCKKTLSGAYELERHIQIMHEGIRDYNCRYCGKTYGSPGNLTRHLNAKHDGGEPFLNELKPDSMLSSVMNTLSNAKVCHMCTKEFTNKTQLRTHLSIYHLKEQRSKCLQCETYINTHSDMRKHVRDVHDKRRSHKCPECGKGFTQKTFLERHIRGVHTGERPHICDICHKGFPEKRNLKVHSWTHTGERPYPCSFCTKSFRRTHHLKKHMDATHGPDSYENAKKLKNDLNSADLDDDDFGEEEEEFEYKQEEEEEFVE